MLHKTLHSCDYWKRKKDKHRDCPETIMGVWPAQGHCNPGDPTYPAGFGGKYEDKLQYPILTPVLERLGEKATLLVKEKRPDIYNLLEITPSTITPLTRGKDLRPGREGCSSTKIPSCCLRTAVRSISALIILGIALILHFLSS